MYVSGIFDESEEPAGVCRTCKGCACADVINSEHCNVNDNIATSVCVNVDNDLAISNIERRTLGQIWLILSVVLTCHKR